MSTVKVTDATFEQEVLQDKGAVLVDFWAEWCGPCKAIGPVLEELSAQFAGKIKIAKVNIDENPNTPNKFRIRSIPTLVLFKNGQPVSTKVGSLPKAALAQWLTGEVA
ncbi:MAG: thioredoxin [Holosporales bacterium]